MNRRPLGRLAAAAIGAGALALSVPGVAHASTASVSPGTVAAGGAITVHVTCTGATEETIPAQWGLASGTAQPEGTGTLTLTGGSGSITFHIPAGTPAGSYSAGGFCPGGDQAVMAHFTVSPAGAPRGGSGMADGGTALALAGAGVLAAAGAAGGLALMRRRSDAPVA